ncbi:hypothetical protein ACPA9J_31505 [Pseudomonas aeruginosa]
MFSFHHAILDGWSGANPDRRAGRRLPWRAAAGPAPALACHVREELAALASPAAVGYWTGRWRREDDPPRRLRRPRAASRARSRPAIAKRCRTASSNDSPGHCGATRTAVEIALLAAHCLTLHLFSRSDSVVTGAISNGRPELPDADRMVGLFLNYRAGPLGDCRA